MTIVEALADIQAKLKAPKDQNAGRYRYRNIEDINEAVKPLAAERGCAVIYTDRCIFNDQSMPVCVSTCTLTNGTESITADGFALVNVNPKNMSCEQSCGSASSYARKYAACGLFAIDSSEKDPDRLNATTPEQAPIPRIDPEILKAKKRLWDAVVRWSELNGVDPKAESEAIKADVNYRDTRAYLNGKAQEYEEKLTP